MPELIDRFLSGLDLQTSEAMFDLVPLASQLDVSLAEAQKAWPAIRIAPEVFVVHLAAQLRDQQKSFDPSEIAGCMEALNIADLYLACGCARGDEAALDVFKERYLPEIARALRRLRLSDDQRSEAAQRVLERILVSSEAKPARIGHYSGRGSLAGWVRVSAAHLALNMVRDEKKQPMAIDEHAYAELPDTSSDPELALLKELYAGEFRFAFKQAWADLPKKDRALLSFSYLEQLSIDQIAPIYRVHRATIARWLARARLTLLDGTRAQLTNRLGLSQGDFRQHHAYY
jgi:RNA polymerase sigma-70 factor (ECF subfamily)